MHMRRLGLLVMLALGVSVGATTPAWAGSAEALKAYERGDALLSDGDFDAALASYKVAAKADPENPDYFQRCAVVSRVIRIREQLTREKDAEVWGKMAQALFTFYRSNEVYGEMLALAQAMYDKSGCGASAAALAESHLAVDENEAAAELLGSLSASKATNRTEALHGIALARLGQVERARAIAEKVKLEKGCDARECYDVARLQALVGMHDKALETLKCAFESTPPAWLADFKAETKVCGDFGDLKSAPRFVQVLQTKSKIKAGCGGCSTPCGKSKSSGCSKDKHADKEGGCQHDKQKH
jgi:tetratricopeptide (TPR) repeat protein